MSSRAPVLEVTSSIRVPLREFSFRFSRSSGAGGQNVNKVNTRVTLRWNVAASPSLPPAVRDRFVERNRRRIGRDGRFAIHSQRFRDQGRNVADCLEKLRQLIREAAVAPRARRPGKPTRASKERRLESKRQRSLRKAERRRPSAD